MWAPSGTTGYDTNFTEIQAAYTGSSSSGYTFTGDLDGSDNWDEICKVDPEGTKDAATNYPAFDYARNYGETAGLTGTKYETGWYIPSIAELYDVYINEEVVQKSLTAAGGFELEDRYWSSSQGDLSSDACFVYFYNGNVGSSEKNNLGVLVPQLVLVVQAFNVE